MADVIERDDGLLIAGAYRDRLFGVARRSAVREIDGWSAHGDYMLVRQVERDGYHVAVSPHNGHLLAECITAALQIDDRTAGLLYVEALEHRRFYVMASKSGHVSDDRICTEGDLHEAVAAHLLAPVHIRVSGDVPLVRNAAARSTEIEVPEAQVLSWESIDPDFRFRVPLIAAAQLQPWKRLRARHFGTPRALVAAGVGAIAVLAWWLWPSVETTRPQPQAQVDVLAAGYARWSEGLPLGDALRELAGAARAGQSVSGWNFKVAQIELGRMVMEMEARDSQAASAAVMRVLGKQVSGTPGSRVLRAERPVAVSPRDRAIFEAALDRWPDLESQVERLSFGPWRFYVTPTQREGGGAYNIVGLVLVGQASPSVLVSMADRLEALFPNAIVRKAEYWAKDWQVAIDVSLFTR